MTRLLRFATGSLLSLVALTALAGVALAGHEHDLQTPGTCVVNIARGQTSIDDPNHGGYHRFHDNVHTGTPGNGPLAAGGDGPVKVGRDTQDVCDVRD